MQNTQTRKHTDQNKHASTQVRQARDLGGFSPQVCFYCIFDRKTKNGIDTCNRRYENRSMLKNSNGQYYPDSSSIVFLRYISHIKILNNSSPEPFFWC